MASLPDVPKGHELEEFVAATFQCSGYYIDKNVEDEYAGTPTLEIDAVATSYHEGGSDAVIIEVKSGKWGFRDLFTLFGWMTYLKVDRAILFATTRPPEDQKFDALKSLASSLGIVVIACRGEELPKVAKSIEGAGYAVCDDAERRDVWRFVYWAERRFMEAIREALREDQNPQAQRAKEYLHLVNDEVFFVQSPRKRAVTLYTSYRDVRTLARDAARTLAGAAATEWQVSAIMDAAMRSEKYPLVQACMYVQHRGRLAILKALVDRILSDEQEPVGGTFSLADLLVPQSYRNALRVLKKHTYVHRYPLFWQVFFWSWGGFIISALKDDEYSALSAQTGVPVNEIDNAMAAFDIIFGEQFRTTIFYDQFAIVKLVPAAIRGLGAFHRIAMRNTNDYAVLGLDANATSVLGSWHEAGRLLIEPA